VSVYAAGAAAARVRFDFRFMSFLEGRMANNLLQKWAGKWALVTGASAGIGLEIAKRLAAGGANLVLTARRTDRLEHLASEISSKYRVHVEVFAADLAEPGTPTAIHAFTADRRLEIELLVNNAGFGAFGYIHEIDPARLAEMIQVNCTAVAVLTQLYAREMIARRHGDILIVSSVAAFQPVPFTSAYAATKAFDLLFSEGIAEELRPLGVNVCALCPGPTITEFQSVARQPSRAFRSLETAEKVARVGLEAMAEGKTCVISGGKNWLMIQAERFSPRRLVASMAAKVMRPPTA
jgi:short-subunit dehydrogenase